MYHCKYCGERIREWSVYMQHCKTCPQKPGNRLPHCSVCGMAVEKGYAMIQHHAEKHAKK